LGFATLFVRDHGIGIAPEHHARIFRLFERLHTRQEYEGTGIGLALCKRIVEQHGGRMWLDSAPQEGTTVYFQLPKTEDPPS
jgi:signal transduction histidine kinase